MIVVSSLTMSETLQDYVRRLRIEKNLSAVDVETRSSNTISDAYILQIENGHARNPSPEKLKALAKGLGVSEDEIFRVARGRPAQPEGVYEIMAESFGGRSLSNADWYEIESVIRAMITTKEKAKEKKRK